jgi:hypothetical protein
MMPTWVLIIAAWYGLGVWGFTYWWRKDYDLTVGEAPIAVAAGFIGPFAWLIGLSIHGKSSVVILRRSRP